MAEEQLILVDEGNRATGTAGKTLVHRAGLLHRAFSIFIVRPGRADPAPAAQLREISLRRAVGEFLLRTSAPGRANRLGRAPTAQRGTRRDERAVVRLLHALPDRARPRHAGERIRLRLFRPTCRAIRSPTRPKSPMSKACPSIQFAAPPAAARRVRVLVPALFRQPSCRDRAACEADRRYLSTGLTIGRGDGGQFSGTADPRRHCPSALRRCRILRRNQ